MLWRLTSLVAVVALSAAASILPERFAGYVRGEVAQIKPADPEIWNEYGLNSAQRAEYTGPDSIVTVTAYRMSDPTGAFAAFQWQRPPDAQSGVTAASIPTGTVVAHANYLVVAEGGRLNPVDAQQLYAKLPDQVHTSLPPLYAYLPKRGRIPNSERYLLGKNSLAKFEPRIPGDLAGLDRGAEAQIARYRNGRSEFQLTLISYPTPQMAIAFARKFDAIPGAVVRRTGPLLAVIPEGATASGAARYVQEINYNPSFTWNEYVPKDTPQDAAKMILAIIALAGGLIALSLVMGLMFGGSKVLAKRLGWISSDEGLTSLHLGGK